METGGLGADSGAQSGANIKFTTKRGGKQYHGSVFYEPRSNSSMPIPGPETPRARIGSIRVFTTFGEISAGR